MHVIIHRVTKKNWANPIDKPTLNSKRYPNDPKKEGMKERRNKKTEGGKTENEI